MFMVVTYPWPVTSALVELTGPQPLDAAADPAGDAVELPSQHLEQIVSWTSRERLRFRLYRFGFAICAACRVSRRSRKLRG